MTSLRPIRPFLQLAPALFLALALSAAVVANPVPNVPWAAEATFELQPSLSDEFSGPLDLSKWDSHGIRNPDTNCPRWNGPPSLSYPDYSVYYATSTDPDIQTANSFTSYQVTNGELQLTLKRHPSSFFTKREYYCDPTTYTCNHNPNIDCFPTKFNGEPAYRDPVAKTYWGVVHDKCKIEPYCIPHPQYVMNKPRVYNSFVGPHIASKETLQYGFVEARVKIPDSPAILGIWMHSDGYENGYCRYKKAPGDAWNKLQCPSAIRNRMWKEIDVAEIMNSNNFKNKYIPNLHVFSDNKGSFSSETSQHSADGLMGGGPIVLLEEEFKFSTPNLKSLPQSQKVGNDWHYNPGSVYQLPTEWASGYHVIGVHWSPKEIRFYVNGVETRRVANHLIHQPLFIDITYGLNVQWAGEFPPDSQVAAVDYIRTWKVLTDDGEEVSATNPTLDMRMVNEFNNLYGSNMGGVAGMFPAMDAYTVYQSGSTGRMLLLNDTEAMSMTTMRARKKAAKKAKRQARKQMRKMRRQAGGNGNRRRWRKLKRRTRRQIRRLLARLDRIARKGEFVDDPGRTALDDIDPNTCQSGMCTVSGLGKTSA